jgi:hypothetical protein
MVSSRRCLMEWGSRRLAFFGVAFAGVATAPSLAICAVVEGEEVWAGADQYYGGADDERGRAVSICEIGR